jgi:hypothetical protein
LLILFRRRISNQFSARIKQQIENHEALPLAAGPHAFLGGVRK